jgi:hypothetical protein
VVVTLTADQATFVDGVAFDPTGRYLLMSTRAPRFALTVVDAQSGTVVQQVPMSSEPDGISFHWTDPQFVVTNNTDGTMTRFDFANGDLSSVPQQSTFASGGFRGDLSLVGPDGCAYVSQDGTRLADGTVTSANSIVALCPGFTPSTGVAAGPKAQVLFLHGVRESWTEARGDTPASDKLFKTLLDQLRTRFGSQYVTSFDYYQDKGDQSGSCYTPSQGDQLNQAPPAPPSWVPYDPKQNGPTCDSQGDLGQNAVRLDAEIRRLYSDNGNRPVILIGYSMGGETIRSFLSYATHVGNDDAISKVDSVVLMHGVEQGSWLADAAVVDADFIHPLPYYGPIADLIGNLVGLAIPNPNRPATRQFAPASKYMQWVDSYSDRLPDIPMYNTWGDERVTVHHCVLLSWGCVNSDIQNWGDMVLKPGTDNPTQTPIMGGEKFLPGGPSATRWEWAETHRIYWDPTIDPTEITALLGVFNAPEQHMNYPYTEDKLTVADCQTGNPIAESDELFRVISARMNGKTYACGLSGVAGGGGGGGGF